jgi:endonuclease/exonuclease/phosphatase (EEP) superfamily protein YafD
VLASRLLVAGTVLVSLAAALAVFGWPFDLFAHFRWQVAAGTTALVVLAAVLRDRRALAWLGLALLLQGAAAWNSRTADLAAARADAAACRGPQITLVAANLWFRNESPERALQWLAGNPADLVLLMEVTGDWAQRLATLPGYPYRKVLAREDPYGIALLSRWPLASVEAVDFADDGLPSLLATIEVGGRPLQVVGVHTHWPLLPLLHDARDRVLARAAVLAHESPVPTVLMGDLNLTPYAPAFRRLLVASGLRDAYAGRAWRPTWQAGLWPLALPLDHVLVPPEACVVAAGIAPASGSDHRAVWVTLRLD